MEAESAISRGALRRIANGEMINDPVLQCVQLKSMQAQPGQERFRLVWSDVDNFIQSMIASQMNHMIHDGTFAKGSIVRLKQYQQQEVKGKKILVVLACEVLEHLGMHEKIGQPVGLEQAPADGQNGGENARPQAQQQQQQPAAVSANGFYGQKQEVKQEKSYAQQQALPTRGPNSSSYGNIYPIEALSPYAHKWTIKARCTSKSDIKTWHNKNGEGKLFSANFLDETGEIRATGFNEQCDMLYDTFKEGAVYYISSPCRVTMAKKQFSQLNNDYELHFERDTAVEKVEAADQDNVPKVRYNFTTLSDISTVDKDTIIDVIGIIHDVGELSQITSKTTSKPYDKREITLVDATNFSIRLTVWGATASRFEAEPETVCAFKGVKVSDFGGRSLSLLASGSMQLNPDIDEAFKLKGWYDAGGASDGNFATHAQTMGSVPGQATTGKKQEYKTIAQVHDEQLGMSEEAVYFTLKATVVYVKQDNFAYPACQSEGCNKKVVEVDPGQWRCEKCDKAFERPVHRYVLSCNVSDHTGQIWLSCFDESARLLLGTSADELTELRENDEKAFTEKVADANCRTWVFRCRAKMDTFQEQQRVRYQVSSASPINFPAESARLADMIKQYSIQDDQGLFHQ